MSNVNPTLFDSPDQELAALIAEQEADAQWGHKINYRRELSLDQPLSQDADAGTLADVVGSADSALQSLGGDVPAEAIRRIGRPQKWTRRAIIKHIRAWVKEHDTPPKYNEWVSPQGRGIPSSLAVARRFGTFNEAIRAAGFEPRKIGGCDPARSDGRRTRPQQRRCARLTSEDLAAAYVLYDRQRLSVPLIADLLWQRYGYPSPNACKCALWKGFRAEGFRIRTKSEARMALPVEKRKAIGAAMRQGRQLRAAA